MTLAIGNLDELGTLEQDVLRAFQDLLAAIRRAEAHALTQVGGGAPEVGQAGETAAQQQQAGAEPVLAPDLLAEVRRFEDGIRGSQRTPEDDGRVGGDAVSGADSGAAEALRAVREVLLPAVETFGRRLDDLVPNTGQNPARQGMYAATAFVDERMIALGWVGRRDWMNWPLELQLFNSRSGGQRVFDQIDDLGRASMSDRALATVYLCMLALGFAGQYDSDRDARRLATYRHHLLKLVVGNEPDIENAGARLTHVSAPPQQAGQVRFLPYLRPWILAGVGIVVAFLAIGHGIWMVRTVALDDAVSRVTQTMGY